MQTVGMGELKRQLSYYLREAEAGRRVIITVQGKPIAQLTSVSEKMTPAEKRLWAMVTKGLVQWKGGRPKSRRPVAENRGPQLLSELVIEGRR
jgi:prevent-host-death family protein